MDGKAKVPRKKPAIWKLGLSERLQKNGQVRSLFVAQLNGDHRRSALPPKQPRQLRDVGRDAPRFVTVRLLGSSSKKRYASGWQGRPGPQSFLPFLGRTRAPGSGEGRLPRPAWDAFHRQHEPQCNLRVAHISIAADRAVEELP